MWSALADVVVFAVVAGALALPGLALLAAGGPVLRLALVVALTLLFPRVAARAGPMPVPV